MQATKDTPRAEFATHKLNEQGFTAAKTIAMEFTNLVNYLESVCTESREFSIAKTKLEEACFFAKKAMAINLGYQEPPVVMESGQQ